MNDSEVNEIATDVLKRNFGDLGLVKVDSLSTFDFDGTPVIEIKAQFARSPLSAERSPINAIHEIRTSLLQKDESRFVLIDTAYDDEANSEQEDVE